MPEKLESYTIQTVRLRLQLLSLEDAPALYDYARDPEVARFTSWTEHRNQAESRAFVEYVQSRHNETPGQLHLVWGIRAGEKPSLIGTISFGQENAYEAHVDYALARAYWGKGYVTEAVKAIVKWAFAHLPDLERIKSGCLSRNIGSVRVLEKAGFSVTERYKSRRDGKFKGALLETTLFSLDRRDLNL